MRNRAKNARLTTKQQKLLIKNALNDETVNEILNNYRPSSVLTKIIAYALKNQKVNLCYITAFLISLIKN